jgi:hypothetical protein
MGEDLRGACQEVKVRVFPRLWQAVPRKEEHIARTVSALQGTHLTPIPMTESEAIVLAKHGCRGFRSPGQEWVV